MKDLILDVYRFIKQEPRTVKQVAEELDMNYRYAWTKTEALSELGKIHLFESKREEGTLVAYLNGKKAEEDAEIEALGMEEIQQ